jgi:hypothetical protein
MLGEISDGGFGDDGAAAAVDAGRDPSDEHVVGDARRAGRSGFDSLRNRAVQFAKENAEAAFALAQELAHAKDLQHLMTLQSQYAEAQMRAFTSQTQELGRLLTGAMQNMRTGS